MITSSKDIKDPLQGKNSLEQNSHARTLSRVCGPARKVMRGKGLVLAKRLLRREQEARGDHGSRRAQGVLRKGSGEESKEREEVITCKKIQYRENIKSILGWLFVGI